MAQALLLVSRILRAFESGDLSVFPEILTPDAVVKNPSLTMHGPQEFAQRVQEAFVDPFSDARVEIVDAVESDNAVAAEIKSTVRHTGTMKMPGGDLPATGKTVVIEEVSLIRIMHNKIVSWHSYYDLMGIFRQLGLVIGPAGSAKPAIRP